jgi:YD repeat-containing protein
VRCKEISFGYDPFNRLTKLTDALAGITQYGYDGVDHLVLVSDPKSLITSYAVDGLDNQKQLVSPDTGTTDGGEHGEGRSKVNVGALHAYRGTTLAAVKTRLSIQSGESTPRCRGMPRRPWANPDPRW